MLDAARIRSLLEELGGDLASSGHRGDLYIVGGAAMALAYDTRLATRDIDAVFEPKAIVYDAATRVAERHSDLDTDWLNGAVKGFMLGADPAATVLLESPGLTVRVASPSYLFALKAAAARVEPDADDLAALYRLNRFGSAQEALDHLARMFPAVVLLPRTQYLIEEIAAAQAPPTPG